MDNYNYPIGADNKSAPWNQKDNETIERYCTITETISKKALVRTTDYTVGEDYDENGKYSYCCTDETDFVQSYKENEYTVLELIKILKSYIMEESESCAKGTRKAYILDELLKACDGWVQEEIEVYRED